MYQDHNQVLVETTAALFTDSRLGALQNKFTPYRSNPGQLVVEQ